MRSSRSSAITPTAIGTGLETGQPGHRRCAVGTLHLAVPSTCPASVPQTAHVVTTYTDNKTRSSRSTTWTKPPARSTSSLWASSGKAPSPCGPSPWSGTHLGRLALALARMGCFFCTVCLAGRRLALPRRHEARRPTPGLAGDATRMCGANPAHNVAMVGERLRARYTVNATGANESASRTVVLANPSSFQDPGQFGRFYASRVDYLGHFTHATHLCCVPGTHCMMMGHFAHTI